MIDHEELSELIAESGFDDSLQDLINRVDKAEAENIELKSKISALQSRLDGGIRMYATRSPHSGIWADTVNGVDKRNSILVLDEEVTI